jgi:hypothetical protein
VTANSSDRKWFGDGYANLIFRLARRHLARGGAHHEIAGRHATISGQSGQSLNTSPDPG